MADIKTIALPLVNTEYDSNNEALTRRTIEQAIEDINVKITTVQRMQSTVTSKASKRHQFLLMGMKHV
jgi:hypothetical protein|tara:strand:+ start:2716 stop:2919 length:204 start_codon:yes stop_codon:yes gene_type:complete